MKSMRATWCWTSIDCGIRPMPGRAEEEIIVDRAFLAAAGDPDAFGRWMGMGEIPLRRSLARFARHVDVEVVLQETFMRMWIVANDAGRHLTGPNASVRFAFKVARNVAHEELRKSWSGKHVDLDDVELPDQGIVVIPFPDPLLHQAIHDCVEKLPTQPKLAIKARMEEGPGPDRDIAASIRMKVNTFLQNVVRARRFIRQCLEQRGIRLGEAAS
jgi:DNA-directed RNA polymerase specialized sigma24 family protein